MQCLSDLTLCKHCTAFMHRCHLLLISMTVRVVLGEPLGKHPKLVVLLCVIVRKLSFLLHLQQLGSPPGACCCLSHTAS